MSARILNAQGILSSDVPTGNLVWVDSRNGVDALATRGRMTIPFRTLVAARDAAKAGDTIIVLPGAHDTDQQLAKANVNWHFMNGVLVSGTAATPLFLADSAMTFNVTGAATFVPDGGGTHVLEVTHSSANVYFQGWKLLGTESAIKIDPGGSVVVEADLISGDLSSAIDMAGGTLAVRSRQINSYGLHGIKMSGGTLDLDAFQIKSTLGNGIYFGGGTARIRAFEVWATSAAAVEFTSGGTLTIQDSRLVSTYSHANGRAVYASGGSSGIKLHSCVLISHSSASISIDAANPGFTVQFHGMANYGKGANISGPTLTTSPAGLNVGSLTTIT